MGVEAMRRRPYRHPHGQRFSIMGFTVRDRKIVEIGILADPQRLRRFDLTVFE